MTDSAHSNWNNPQTVTNLDISYLVVFSLQIICDIILIFGAFKKIPHHAVPWLWANAIIIAVFLVSFCISIFHGFFYCVFLFSIAAYIYGKGFNLEHKSMNLTEIKIELILQVFIALMLFFGHVKFTMGQGDFVATLAGIGVLGAVHIFSWLVVFQFRKNLIEEQRVLSRLIASAPLPPTGK